MRLVAGVLLAASALLGVAEAAAAQLLAREVPRVIVARSSGATLPDALRDVYVAEGRVLYDAGRYKEAAASFERALQLGVARPPEAARGVARSYEKLGNRKQAGRWADLADLLEHPERAKRPLRGPLLLKI
jgi:tetratricopeptide (TPR) repeat protein